MSNRGESSQTTERSVEVLTDDRSAGSVVDVQRWSVVAAETFRFEGINHGELGLTFVGSTEMAELNHEHMGHEGPTDVLAFPMDVEDGHGDPKMSGAGGLAEQVPVALGDIVICPEVAEKQAPEHCGSFDAELSLLVVHGVLHLLGHDHYEPQERREMLARENEHLQRCGFDHPEFRSS